MLDIGDAVRVVMINFDSVHSDYTLEYLDCLGSLGEVIKINDFLYTVLFENGIRHPFMEDELRGE